MAIPGSWRLWAVAQTALAVDALLWPAAGSAGGWRTDRELATSAPPVLGVALVFLILAIVAVRIPAAGSRWWFWVAASAPAAAWVPAMPFVALMAGPPLASAAGLALAGFGLVTTAALIAFAAMAALEARRLPSWRAMPDDSQTRGDSGSEPEDGAT